MASSLNSVEVRIKKCPIPIIWIDTSIIINITNYKKNPSLLESTQRERISLLYELLYTYTRQGKVICPRAEQEDEIWVARPEWLDTMNELSLGIQSCALKSIQDKQLHIAMSCFIKGQKEIELSYRDIFYKDPTQELRENLSKPFFVTVNSGILFGAEVVKRKNLELLTQLNAARAQNVKSGVTFDSQLEQEFAGEITTHF